MARKYKTKRKTRRSSRRKTSRRNKPITAEQVRRLALKPTVATPRGYHWNKDSGWIARGHPDSIKLYGPTPGLANYEQLLQRKINKYRGLGDYKSNFELYRKYIPRAVGAVAGALSGGSLQSAMAGWRGGGQFSKKYMGWGDYGAPVTNQIMEGGGNQLSINADANNLSGDIYVNHREFVCNITVGSTGFENRLFELNPGLKQVFPFLSQLAVNFSLYSFEGLIFEFVPLSGEASSVSNCLGKVVLATDYDSEATGFRDISQMSNYDYANSAKPSVSIIHGVETDPRQRSVNMKYVRSGECNRDKTFTDYGVFQVATQGVPQNGIVGELWVAYNVRLSRANITSSAGGDVWFDQFFTRSFASPANTAMISESNQGGSIPSKYIVNKAISLRPAIPDGNCRVYDASTLGGCFMQVGQDHCDYEFPGDVRVGEVYTLIYNGHGYPGGDMVNIGHQGCSLVEATGREGLTLYSGDQLSRVQGNPQHFGDGRFISVFLVTITEEPTPYVRPFVSLYHTIPPHEGLSECSLFVTFTHHDAWKK